MARHMIVFLLGCLGFLAACDGPGPGFRGVEAREVSVGANRFSVYVGETHVQAVRRNASWNIALPGIAMDAVVAMQRASGCRIRHIAGDAAVLVGRMHCGGSPNLCEVDADLRGRRGFVVPLRRACPGEG